MQTTDPKYTRRQITRALLGAAVLLFIIFVASLINTLYIGNIRQQAYQNLDLERDLTKISTAVIDAETGQRGYLLTGQRKYLEPYRDALYRTSSGLERVEFLENNGYLEGAKLDTLKKLIGQKFDELALTIRVFDEGRPEEAWSIVRDGSGKIFMNDIRRILEELQATRRQEVQSIRFRASRLYEISTALSLSSLVLLFLIGIYLYYRLVPLIKQLVATRAGWDAEALNRRIAETKKGDLLKTLKIKGEELDHFAYIASHDLQEPLRTVSNFSEIIEEEYGEQMGENGKTYFGFINAATKRMRLLIDKLLQYSLIGSKSVPGVVDLNHTVRIALNNLSDVVADRGAEVSIGQLPVIQGHEVELIELFENLIGNAIKFTPPDREPKVTISCFDGNDAFRISIEDEGIGIDAAARKKVFQLFSRVHPDGAYEGSGFGLTFSRRIVELHGGHLFLDSKTGQGSIFSFTLTKPENENKTQPNFTY